MSDTLSIALGETVTAGLDRLASHGGDLTPAMGEIARYLASQIETRFSTETDPDGAPWKPSERVAGYTDADGRHHPGDGGQTLTLHGYLRRSMREDYGSDYAAAGPQASGPAAIYARLMQEGGTIRAREGSALKTPHGRRGSITIPARPYLGFNDATDAPEVIHILSNFLAGALGAPA